MGISLERSIFYRALVRKHPKVFQQASNECWLICIPQDDSVKQCNLGDVNFIRAHMFKLSPFLKDHYVPVHNKDVSDLEIQEGNLRISTSNGTDRLAVKILFDHDAFNNNQQFYKILLVQRPLISPHLYDESTSLQETVNEHSPQPVICHSQCLNHLKQIHRGSVDLVLKKVACLTASQEMIFKTRDKSICALDSVISWATSIFKTAAPDGRLEDEFLVENCIESLFVEPFHDKLMSLLISDCALEAKMIREKVKQMVKLNIDMRSLASECVLDSFKVTPDVIELLDEMPLLKTPLEKAFTFKKVLDKIKCNLQSTLLESRSPFSLEPVQCLAPDDLVAATICLCIEIPTKVDMIIYHFKYIESFGSRIRKMNELDHSLVTFEVALGYISSFEAESFIANRSSKRSIKGNKHPDEESANTPQGSYCAEPASLSRSSLPEICHLNANAVSWYVDSLDSPSSLASLPRSSDKLAASASDHHPLTNRENSFKSFRSRNCHLDKQLAQIQEMIDDLSIASDGTCTSGNGPVSMGKAKQTRGSYSRPQPPAKQVISTKGASCKFSCTCKDHCDIDSIFSIANTSSSFSAEGTSQVAASFSDTGASSDTDADDLG